MRPLYLLPALPMLLFGCATPANHYDPLEPINRPIYAFNRAVDSAVVKPIAQGYVAVTPTVVRTGASNFFGNLEDVYIGASNLLQGKVSDAGKDLGRVLINSTVGLLGVFDVASQAELPKHKADFGTVLGHWGVGSGPYIVAPFIGSKTLRDSADWVGGYWMDPLRAVPNRPVKNSLSGLKFVNLRASLLSATAVVDEASFGDEYSFVRDSYLQRRYSLVWDGNPPEPLKFGDDDDAAAPTSSDAPANAAPEAPAKP
ncbi:VacJ family lipoprotein [Chitinimonas sp.]|uniref:MlaA family lipoprotein n=1 Tax=Chitinimonas sp. TaxID=1934313 RepID=UPI0035B05953